MVYVHTILRDVAGLFKVGRLVAYAATSNFRIRNAACSSDFQRLPIPPKQTLLN